MTEDRLEIDWLETESYEVVDQLLRGCREI